MSTFSFFNPGLVRTGKRGHAFVFNPNPGESYIYLKTLAMGAQSRAQLVAKTTGNHEVVIRKVGKVKLPIEDRAELTSLREDREIRILALLATFVHDPALMPRWTTCVTHENVAVTSGGPESTMLWAARVSYWKLCNNGSMADWLAKWNEGDLPTSLISPSDASSPAKRLKELPFPVTILARCIAQIAETLHIMYQSGPEAVYHCDLHLANVFLHLPNPDDNAADCPLPDFYIGDFGLARTATEAHADNVAVYGDWNPADDMSPPGRHESPPGPGAVLPTERRRWDMLRFVSGLESLVQLATQPMPKGPASTKAQVDGLRQLMQAIDFLDAQDQALAARQPESRPPPLVEVAREARKLEAEALAAERESLQLRAFVALGRRRGKHLVTAGSPFVLAPRAGVVTTHAAARARAEEFAKENIGGGWTVVDSV